MKVDEYLDTMRQEIAQKLNALEAVMTVLRKMEKNIQTEICDVNYEMAKCHDELRKIRDVENAKM